MSDRDKKAAQHAMMMARLGAEREFNETVLPKIRKEGQEALLNLLPVAKSDTGQSGVVAKFLLGIYNGKRFPFNLSELRRLDRSLFNQCMKVLAMDFQPEREIHEYVKNGSQVFEELAETWCPTGLN